MSGWGRLTRAVLAIGAALALLPGAAAGKRKHSHVAPTPSPPRVAVYLTTSDLKQTLARQRDLVFTSDGQSGATSDTITIDPSQRYQQMVAGFGVAMTDTSAYELERQLPARLRDQVMRRLFSPTDGIGLSFLRVPVGGSDYIVGSPYTYDDVPAGASDPALQHFSTAHDDPYVIPAIRQALAENHSMSIMANPWTPPAWMKTDDTLITTTGPYGTLKPQYYGSYADYLVKFLLAYRSAGIPIDYLGVQNEPLTPLLFVAHIPESYLSPTDEGRLIHSYVAPALEKAGLDQKILAFDDGYERDLAYVPPVMTLAGSDVAGLAYHCYLSDPSSMAQEHSRYPSVLELETECSSKLSNLQPAQMAIRSLRNWAQGIQLWNAALDEHLGPKIGDGCKGLTAPSQGEDCIAPVIVDNRSHTYTLTSDFWQLAHFSAFIHLGATRIGSSTPNSCPDSPGGGYACGPEDVAFENPDGSRVVVATTNDGQGHTVGLTDGRNHVAYSLADGATATFVWPAPRPAIARLRLRHRVRQHRCTSLRFHISEPALVTVRFLRRRGRHQRLVSVRRVNVPAGSDRMRFGGRCGAPRLRPGRYRMTITAADAGGDRSRTLTRRLRVTR